MCWCSLQFQEVFGNADEVDEVSDAMDVAFLDFREFEEFFRDVRPTSHSQRFLKGPCNSRTCFQTMMLETLFPMRWTWLSLISESLKGFLDMSVLLLTVNDS